MISTKQTSPTLGQGADGHADDAHEVKGSTWWQDGFEMGGFMDFIWICHVYDELFLGKTS